MILQGLFLKASAVLFILSNWTVEVSSVHHNSAHDESFNERDTVSGIFDTTTVSHAYHGDNFYSDSLCTNFLTGTLRQIDVCLQYDAKSSVKYLLSDVHKDNKIDLLTVRYSNLKCRDVAPIHFDYFSTKCTQVGPDRYQKTSLPAIDDNCIVGRGRLR